MEPEYEGMWNGFRVLQVLDGGKAFVIEGWPTPILADARVHLPPEPYHPTYGPAARDEAQRQMRNVKNNKMNLGPYTKKNLCRVAKGEQPLTYSLWYQTGAYVRRVLHEREREQDLRECPMAVDPRGLLAHEGSGLVWGEHRPTLVNPGYDPTAKVERVPRTVRSRYELGSGTQSKHSWSGRRIRP